ncbi:MAG: MraY family glycosyltransferase [Cytophagales bacterium]|nr:MraY family glycosyltransferase [Cytophagales bacterium]
MFINSILCFLWSFFITVFAIPSIINVAHFKRILDEPNLRTVHNSLTPRLGGIAIFAGFTSALTIFGDFDKEVQQIVAGSIVLFFIGLKDDIVSVSVFKKFFVQVLATGIVVFIGNIRITSFQGLFGLYELPMGISYAFTFLVIIGITNAINLVDGIDGLAGTILVFTSAVFGIFFYFGKISNSIYFTQVAFCLVGSVLGFLKYNFNKAIIFMGDTGSLVCGFILSVMAIKFIEYQLVPSASIVSMAILIIPILDTTRVFIIRVLAGKSPFSPDKNHLHHILKKLNLKSGYVVSVLMVFNLVAIITITSISFLPIHVLFLILALMCAVFVFILEALKSKVKPLE